MNGAPMLPEFDQEMANTRKMLEMVPDEHLDYRPHAKSWTLRELAGHVSNIPMWTTMTLGTSELDLSEPFEQRVLNSRADLLAQFEASSSGARSALEAATAEDFQATWTLKSGDQVHFSMPKGAVYRSFVMNHMVHHRAQLGVYLRMLDVKVPGMYGPSADESM